MLNRELIIAPGNKPDKALHMWGLPLGLANQQDFLAENKLALKNSPAFGFQKQPVCQE